MVAELITEKRQGIRGWMWRQRFERNHSSRAGLTGDGAQIQLLLGVRGSGADHLGRLLSSPGVPLRYYHNPLQKFVPPLSLSDSRDRLALPFTKTLDPRSPLLRVLRLTQEFDDSWALDNFSNKPGSALPETLPCLVKESRALLATEAVLRDLHCKAMLYTTDPVKTVDRLLAAEGLNSSYLVEEGRSVLAPYFLGRFLRKDYTGVMHAHRRIRRTQDARKRAILHRVLVIALIQHMFRMLAARYPQQVILVEYDRIIENPTLLEDMLERLLGDAGLRIGHKVMVEATFAADGAGRVCWKHAWPEKKPAAGFLTPEELRLSYQMLKDCGLATRITEQSRYQPVPGKLQYA